MSFDSERQVMHYLRDETRRSTPKRSRIPKKEHVVAKEMLINVSEGEECRIALVEDGRLEELYMERSSSTSHVGNIYKGRVTNVEPSIQAAFVDFGLGRNGFLHISDLMPTYFGAQGEDIHESVGRKLARRDRPPIQRCLRRGDEIIVQIIKEGIGTKGPTLTTYLLHPRPHPGDDARHEQDGRLPQNRGRRGTPPPAADPRFPQAAQGRRLHHPHRRRRQNQDRNPARSHLSHAPLDADSSRSANSGPGPMELYTEGDLVTRTVRDVFTTDIDSHRRRRQGRRQARQGRHQAGQSAHATTRSNSTKAPCRCSTNTASSAKSS